MIRKLRSHIIGIAFVVVALAAAVASAAWQSRSVFGLFTDSGPNETTANVSDQVPDVSSVSGRDGTSSAYRVSSILSIGQEAYLKPAAVGTTQAGDFFGGAVAVSGDTVVVGAPEEGSNTTGINSAPNDGGIGKYGAAYVFVRNAGGWMQEAYLKPSTMGYRDEFGFSVAISGDTVVVGCPAEDSDSTGVNSTPNDNTTDSGAAYVFVRNGTTWTQQAYLKPAAVGSSQAYDRFGYSVAISGDTIVVGAQFESSSTTGVNSTPNESALYAGAAYVFRRSGTTWSQEAYLKPAVVGATQADDRFGYSVAVSGDTVAVGAYLEASSSTGINTRPNEKANSAGAAYVFTRDGSIWSQRAYLKPAEVGRTQIGDYFGSSIALAGDTLVVGARGEGSRTAGVNSTPDEHASGAGAAYVFTRTGEVWTQQAYLKPAFFGALQGGDSFGYSVAVSGDTIVAGSPGEDSSITGVNSTPNENSSSAGAAYVFTRSGNIWTQQSYLKPAGMGRTMVGDQFGGSVSVSDGTVIVGAELEDSSSLGVNSRPNEIALNSGTSYVFANLDSIPTPTLTPTGTATNTPTATPSPTPTPCGISGTIDTTFGVDGTVLTSVGSGTNDAAYGGAIQPDGKIITAGSTSDGTNYSFALTRHNADGSLDMSFGIDGRVVTQFGTGYAYAYAVAIQSDGKIVAVGTADGDFALSRYNTDGSLDTSFGIEGKVLTDINGGDDRAYAVAIQPDGKIVAAGDSSRFAIARYLPDGSLDSSFGVDGKVITQLGLSSKANGVTIQSDGKIVAAGTTFFYSNSPKNDFALLRYNTDGSLDASFGNGGKVVTRVTFQNDKINAVALQTDGKILATGASYGTNQFSDIFALTRYNTDGSLDVSFGSEGKVLTVIGSSSGTHYDIALAMAIQPDGKIMAAGQTYNASQYSYALARYDPDGLLDGVFDTDGIVVSQVGTGYSFASAVVVQTDGRIVIAGVASNGTDGDFALVRYNGDTQCANQP